MHPDELYSGMILTHAVLSPFGDTLLQAGSVLTDRQVDFLRASGIDDVPVVDETNVGDVSQHGRMAQALRFTDEQLLKFGHNMQMTRWLEDIRAVIMHQLGIK